MKIKKNKYLYIIVTSMLVLGLITLFSLNKLPNQIYVNESFVSETISLPRASILNKLDYAKDSIKVKLFGLIKVKSIPVIKVPDLEIYPGGTSVGIKLYTDGVLVVGHSEVETAEGITESPAKVSGIELGDVLVAVNGDKIQDSRDLSKKLKKISESEVVLQYLRDGKSSEAKVSLLKEGEEYKLGLWVRDSTSGIGTLTFYDKDSRKFGALGHSITDGDTNKAFTVKRGEIIESSIINIKKGEKGSPGELRGIFVNEKNSFANITDNTESGIFGEANKDIINSMYNKPMKVVFRNEIKEGPAKIITTIDENGPAEYDIEIVKLLPQDVSGPKSMVIKVTDKELLKKTGGIVQGMSGSPIVQDDKIVGAVTHVLINKPEVGYGVYIEWMLQDAGIIE